MTKLINTGLYFHTKRHFVLTFCPESPNFFRIRRDSIFERKFP